MSSGQMIMTILHMAQLGTHPCKQNSTYVQSQPCWADRGLSRLFGK